MSLEEAKQQITRAELQAQEQRQLLQERRGEAEKRREEIIQQEKKIPIPSQRLLRQGMFSGLEGRKRRQVVGKIKEQIGKQKEEIGIFKEELTKFEEKELKPFEKSISERKGEVREYELDMEATELAREVYLGSKTKGMLNPRAKKIYDKMVKLGGKTPKSEIQISNVPIEQWGSYIDPKTGLGYSTTPEVAKTSGWVSERDYKLSKIFTPPKSIFLSPPKNLGRTELKKDFSPVANIKFKDTSSLLDRKFLTTGSPIRKTPLFGSKTTRPLTPSVKPRTYLPTSKPRTIEKKTKTFKISNTFFSKNKKEKKKNFWGI
jgi:hypothetical protein